MRGIPIRQVQEWLGHSSVVVTMRYAHLAHGYGDEMIKRLAPPIPTEGAKPDGRAAKSRHKHSTRKAKQPKSAA